MTNNGQEFVSGCKSNASVAVRRFFKGKAIRGTSGLRISRMTLDREISICGHPLGSQKSKFGLAFFTTLALHSLIGNMTFCFDSIIDTISLTAQSFIA